LRLSLGDHVAAHRDERVHTRRTAELIERM
jgi:hypothetical protein